VNHKEDGLPVEGIQAPQFKFQVWLTQQELTPATDCEPIRPHEGTYGSSDSDITYKRALSHYPFQSLACLKLKQLWVAKYRWSSLHLNQGKKWGDNKAKIKIEMLGQEMLQQSPLTDC